MPHYPGKSFPKRNPWITSFPLAHQQSSSGPVMYINDPTSQLSSGCSGGQSPLSLPQTSGCLVWGSQGEVLLPALSPGAAPGAKFPAHFSLQGQELCQSVYLETPGSMITYARYRGLGHTVCHLFHSKCLHVGSYPSVYERGLSYCCVRAHTWATSTNSQCVIKPPFICRCQKEMDSPTEFNPASVHGCIKTCSISSSSFPTLCWLSLAGWHIDRGGTKAMRILCPHISYPPSSQRNQWSWGESCQPHVGSPDSDTSTRS